MRLPARAILRTQRIRALYFRAAEPPMNLKIAAAAPSNEMDVNVNRT